METSKVTPAIPPAELFSKEKATLTQQQLLTIKLLRQEVRGLKAMLNQYKRDYKKLLEETK